MEVLKRIGFPVAAFVFLFSGAVSAFSLTVYRRGPNPLPTNHVTAVAVAENGTIWVGTGGGGLVTISSEGEWKAITNAEGFNAKQVSDITFRKDEVLVGTEKGLYIRQKDKWTSNFEVAGGKLQKPVLKLVGEELWVGALGPAGGLFRLKVDGVWEKIKGPNNEDMNDTLALEAVGEAIWIGTMNHGLYRYEKGSWKQYGLEQGLPHLYISGLAWDGEGLWISFLQKGVARLEGDEFSAYEEKDGLLSNLCRMIFFDSEEEEVWVGTAKSGLARYDGKRWVSYGKEDGLLGLDIYDIARGPKGIWVGTNIGLVSLTP